MKLLNATCKDCDRRTIGCHAHCPDYKEFRRQLDEENKRRRQIEQDQRIADEDYHSVRRRRRLKR